MFRLFLVLLFSNFMVSIASNSARGQDAIVPTTILNITPTATQADRVCYLMVGKKGRSKTFCGSGGNPGAAEYCARKRMQDEGYTEQFGNEHESCADIECDGDVSCPTVCFKTPLFTVDLDCYACDGTCIQVTGDGETWCEAYQSARATAERINQFEHHGGIICCRVVKPCSDTNKCSKPARRFCFPWRR